MEIRKISRRRQRSVDDGELRACSYEPGNRAGSVTGTNFVVCSYGKFQPGRPGLNPRNTIKMVVHKLVSFATVVALWALVT